MRTMTSFMMRTMSVVMNSETDGIVIAALIIVGIVCFSYLLARWEN